MPKGVRVLVEMVLYAPAGGDDNWVWVAPLEKGPHCHGHGSQVKKDHIHKYLEQVEDDEDPS